MGNIQMIGKSQAEMYRGEKPIETKLAPDWALDDVADHAVDFWLSTEDLPMPDNRVTLDRDGEHPARVPGAATRPRRTASTTSSSRCWGIWACTRITCCHGSRT